jgi:hypothetical protein
MLLSNSSYINQILGRQHSGITNNATQYKPEVMFNRFIPGSYSNFSSLKVDSFPTGTEPPYSHLMGIQRGSMSATTTIVNIGTISSGNLAAGINISSNLNGSGDLVGAINAIGLIISSLSGSGDLISNITGKLEAASTLAGSGDINAALGALSGAIADLLGEGYINNAQLVGALSASGNLSGNGTLTFSSDIIAIVDILCDITSSNSTAANIIGAWFMESALSGESILVADISTIANLIATLAGSGVFTSDINSTAGISADINIGASDPLSAENLAAAIWNSLAASYNVAGSMGEIMNNVGSGADPWNTNLPGSYAAGTAGYIIGNLLASIPDAVWDELEASHTTDSTYGKTVQEIKTLARQIKGLTAAQL